MVHINCHHHHHDHLDPKGGGFPQSDTHLPHPVVMSCPVCINFNFLRWESIPCVNFNSTSFDGSTSQSKIYQYLVPIYHTPTRKSKVVEWLFPPKSSFQPEPTRQENISKIIYRAIFISRHASRPRHILTIYKTIWIRNVRQASRHFVTRYCVTLGSSTTQVGLLREKRKRKATHCGSDYRGTLESHTAASHPKLNSS